jgi:hypothetical protein
VANRKWAVTIIVAFCILFAASRTRILRNWGHASKPLGNAPRIEVAALGVSQSMVEQFLNGDYRIIRNVEAFPIPLLTAFTEKNSSRLTMANPGEDFEATDFISDPSLPRMRLIFGGVWNDQAFVHYEQGGRGHMFILALFKIIPKSEAQPFWRGYCSSPAQNVSELRAKVTKGECRQEGAHPTPE